MRSKPKSRECKFVSFSGIDGAGKSTQIEALHKHLTDAGLRVQVITFWDNVATFTSLREATGHKIFKGDKGVGSPNAPINRRDKNIRSWRMTLVRLFLYFADAISLRRVIFKILRSETEFLICDRYIYDELANLTLSSFTARIYVRWIMRLVPKPDVSYFLDADPVKARARKPEYPLDFLFTCRESYLKLGDLVGGITVIPPLSVRQVEQLVLIPVLQLLSDGKALDAKARKLAVER